MQLAAKVGEEPKEEREGGAEEEASDDGEVEGGVFTAVDDVTGESAEAEGEFSAEVEKGAGEDKEAAEEQEGATEFAEGVHQKESKRNEVKKRGNDAGRKSRGTMYAAPTRNDWVVRLNQLEAGEEVPDFESGGFGCVGAVGAIVANAGAEVVADGAGRGFLGVGGAHGVAPLEDGAFSFQDYGEDFAGAHKVGEFGEEGALAMDRVETAGFFLGEPHGFDGDDLETSIVNAGENLTVLAATDSIGLDDCKCAFE